MSTKRLNKEQKRALKSMTEALEKVSRRGTLPKAMQAQVEKALAEALWAF